MCVCVCVCVCVYVCVPHSQGSLKIQRTQCRYRYREAPLWQNKLDATLSYFLFWEDFTQGIRSLKIVCRTKEVGSELGLEKFRSGSQ